VQRGLAGICLSTILRVFPVAHASAQEPAFAFGNQVVRYEESAGSYHYVFPCTMPTPARIPGSAAALCWPALVGKAQVIDGKLQTEHLMLGLLMVSASLVRFFPGDNKSALLIPDLPTSQMEFTYYPRQRMAAMFASGGVYAFAFQIYCSGCSPGSEPLDPNKAAHLEGEYREFQESLADFYTVEKRISELAERWRVEVNNRNQPVPTIRATRCSSIARSTAGLSPCATPTVRSRVWSGMRSGLPDLSYQGDCSCSAAGL